MKTADQDPKDKAIDLVVRFHPHSMMYHSDISGWDYESGAESAVQCAIICCEEKINEFKAMSESARDLYWKDVKAELESLNTADVVKMLKKNP